MIGFDVSMSVRLAGACSRELTAEERAVLGGTVMVNVRMPDGWTRVVGRLKSMLPIDATLTDWRRWVSEGRVTLVPLEVIYGLQAGADYRIDIAAYELVRGADGDVFNGSF